ncbi:hypothetical protein CMI46_00475 [Candidatus Pacearchaeota archaeon]|nr:hypothetical protein [Candidatus Pacearchaeota archaeon]|tara:strand:- start:8644 stop:8952 length:309 start_codon:yes stop_codon:yes gene_type:complete
MPRQTLYEEVKEEFGVNLSQEILDNENLTRAIDLFCRGNVYVVDPERYETGDPSAPENSALWVQRFGKSGMGYFFRFTTIDKDTGILLGNLETDEFAYAGLS